MSDKYTWDDMCKLNDADMTNLLLFYPANKVPEFGTLQALRDEW